MSLRRVAFLDRDGVINCVPPSGHVASADEFEFLSGAPIACRILIEKGFEIVVVTNQGGIARGYYTMDDYLKVNDRMLFLFDKERVDILDVLFSPYHPACEPAYADFREWRKPAPGMIFEAQKRHGISLADSILAGDMESDIEAGKRAGVGSVFFIGSEKNAPSGLLSKIFGSLLELAEVL